MCCRVLREHVGKTVIVWEFVKILPSLSDSRIRSKVAVLLASFCQYHHHHHQDSDYCYCYWDDFFFCLSFRAFLPDAAGPR